MKSNVVFTLSVLAHGALAASIVGIHPERAVHGLTSISMAETKKKPPPPPPPPAKVETPDPPKELERLKRPTRARSIAPPPKDAPPKEARSNTSQAALDALPDFGVTLSGGPGGLAIPVSAASDGPSHEAEARPAAAAAPPPKPAALECKEAVVKPKPLSVPQPAYAAAARQAGIEGRVRVEVSVDAAGNVVGARLLSGLGHGLDDAALAAARSARFSPATRCGTPTGATFVIAMRFAL